MNKKMGLGFDESPLRRLPPGLTAREYVALDSIRQSAAIIALAHARLLETLTSVCRNKAVEPVEMASCFLDAWSIVDAVDRVRSMVKLLTKRFADLATATEAFMDTTISVRELRNLADHLDSRVDQVIASDSPAIGRLAWTTIESTSTAFGCVLVPGSLRSSKLVVTLPNGGRTITVPTGGVKLSAGAHHTWIDDDITATFSLVVSIDASVAQYAANNGLHGIEVARDALAVGEMSFPEIAALRIGDPRQMDLW